MELENKTIGILLGPGFEELEFWVIYMRLKEAGATVKVIGPDKGASYVGKHGCMEAQAEYGSGEIPASRLDGLHIPGGWSPDKIRRDPGILTLVKDLHKARKIIGLICHAGLVGISAQIVKGKKATGSAGIKDDLVNAGAIWVDEAAFRDGNLVWGRVAKDIPDYCRVLMKALSES